MLPKLSSYAEKVVFGYVGLVKNREKVQQSARLIFTCLRTVAIRNFVLREMVAHCTLVDRCLDGLMQFYLLVSVPLVPIEPSPIQ